MLRIKKVFQCKTVLSNFNISLWKTLDKTVINLFSFRTKRFHLSEKPILLKKSCRCDY